MFLYAIKPVSGEPLILLRFYFYSTIYTTINCNSVWRKLREFHFNLFSRGSLKWRVLCSVGSKINCKVEP